MYNILQLTSIACAYKTRMMRKKLVMFIEKTSARKKAHTLWLI